jgi:hypothetical protein
MVVETAIAIEVEEGEVVEVVVAVVEVVKAEFVDRMEMPRTVKNDATTRRRNLRLALLTLKLHKASKKKRLIIITRLVLRPVARDQRWK